MATITGTTGNDTLFDEDEDDVIDALAGDDSITVAFGLDTIHGDEGVDRLIIDYTAVAGNISGGVFGGSLAGGYDGLFENGTDTSATFDGIEHFTVDTGDGDDSITLNVADGDDIVNSRAGDDIVHVGAGVNQADGGDGEDGLGVLFAVAAPDITFDLATDTHVLPLGMTFANFEYFIDLLTGNGNDTIVSLSGSRNDGIDTRGGNDTITIAGGQDSLLAGSGTDRLILDYSAVSANVTGGPSSGTFAAGYSGVYGNGGFDDLFFVFVENFTIMTGAGDDSVFTGDGDDTLAGGAGADELEGGAGADALDGGDGTDFAVYATAVTASLAAPSENTGDAAGDTYAAIEGFIGSAFDDTLVGGDNPNELRGMDGNDYLQARGANDTLLGGNGTDFLEGRGGQDVLDGGADFDYARYTYATGQVTVDLLTPVLNVGDAAGDEYTDVEGVIGTAFDDTLYGDDIANDLVGLGGLDQIFGRDGNDNLQGGDGNDILAGGAGRDRLVGGSGAFDFALYETAVLASLSSRWQNTGEAQADVYDGIEGLIGSDFIDTLLGDDNDNQLRGMGDDDTIRGLGGADTLLGGDDNDQLEGGTGADALDGGDGFDWARYKYSATEVEVNLANPAANTNEAVGDTYVSIEGLVGSQLNDTLTGDGNINDLAGLAGDDVLVGQDGDDNLQGMEGNDVINGGTGADQLWGGTGDDDFTFSFGEANGETVVDFEGNGPAAGDRLIFTGYGAGSTFVQDNATEWTITSSTFSTSETLTFLNSASIDVANDVLIS